MQFTRSEYIGIGASLVVVVALFGITKLFPVLGTSPQEPYTPSVVHLSKEADRTGQTIADVLKRHVENNGAVRDLIIEDVVTGEGTTARVGDTLHVHFVGMRRNGEVFASSYDGDPFTFTLGAGTVIAGWEYGIVGMHVGGQRILVVPAELAYGDTAVGELPANTTLVFAVELLSIDE